MLRYSRRNHDENMQPYVFDPDFYPPLDDRKESIFDGTMTLTPDFYTPRKEDKTAKEEWVASENVVPTYAPLYQLPGQVGDQHVFASPYIYYVPVYYAVPYMPYGMPYADMNYAPPYTPMLNVPPDQSPGQPLYDESAVTDVVEIKPPEITPGIEGEIPSEPVLSSSTEELEETCIAPTSDGRCQNPIVRFKFCDKHIAHCRRMYKRYKKSCQKASSFPDYPLGNVISKSEEELRDLEKKLRTKYASLNQCIQKRQAFEAECVYRGCYDEAHNYYYGTFPPMREKCEADLNAITEERSRRERKKRETEIRVEEKRKEALRRANREEYTGEKTVKKKKKKESRESRQIERKQRENRALAEADKIRVREYAQILLERGKILDQFIEEISILSDIDDNGECSINIQTFIATFIKMNPNMVAEARWLLDNFETIHDFTTGDRVNVDEIAQRDIYTLYCKKLISLTQEELGRYEDPFVYRIISREGLRFFARHIVDRNFTDEELHKKYIATDDSPEKRVLVDEIIALVNEEFKLADQVYVSPKSEKHSDMVDDSHQFFRVISGLSDNHIDAVISIFAFKKWIKLIQAGLPTDQIILRTYYTKEQLEILKEEFIMTFYDDENNIYMDDEDNVKEDKQKEESADEMPALCASDDED